MKTKTRVISSRQAASILGFLGAFCLFQPAYACADVGAGLLGLGLIMLVTVLGPLLLGGLLVAACDKIKFSGYGLLMGAGTFVIAAPVCLTMVFQHTASAHLGEQLLLLVTPGLLSTLCILVMSLRETKRARRKLSVS